MTVQEALRRTQGKGAGAVNQFSVRYAETLLLCGESPLAAVIANISTARGSFPGVVVLTDRRALAVCGLPGIKRAAVCESNWTCREEPSAIRYKFTFSDRKNAFSMTIDPDTGERFSRQIAVLNGEEAAFDAAGEGVDSGILNPALIRNKRRARRAEERKTSKRTKAEEPGAPETDPQADARRLARQLAEARKREYVADTDPRAVAARLAAELAERESS